jgi:carbonic anhydrase/acetyltransferase-like protein (isoleucine patch superfamily)
MAIIPFGDKTPRIDASAWIADNATVAGDVTLGEGVSIWFGAVLRGDVNHIIIGNGSNVQDNAVIHVTTNGNPTIVGQNVTIGHGAILHACTVEDGALIGMGSVVLDEVVVQKNAMVAAGAVVSPRTVVESGWLWAGVPAKPMRQLTEKELAYMAHSGPHYVALARKYKG